MAVTVPAPGVPGGVTVGAANTTVGNGAAASITDGSGAFGGASGSGLAGAGASTPVSTAGGAGAASSPPVATPANGGAGVVVSSLAPVGSLFVGDTRCFGGGGAVGTVGVKGIPGCGGGGPTDATNTILTLPAANSGGGGGGLSVTQTPEARAGASGVVIIRWSAAPLTLAFNAGGHGTAPAAQTIVALAAGVRPADPVADGYEFAGWYTDAQLTTLADFSAPLTVSTTYYAKWLPTLAATGTEPSPAIVAGALAALMAGIGLMVAARRRRQTD
jgi:uncharacterized repeat protein (TIGR02543 family)/LPXTG-motif cell wall-anchored protein